MHKTKLKMDASQTVKKMKMLSLNLATCQLATWAESAVKFKLTLRKKWNRKPNKNEVGMEWEAKLK